MKLTVEFTCPKCGLLTPGFVELPDDVDQRRSLTLQHECFHCDEPLEQTAKVSEYIDRMGLAEPYDQEKRDAYFGGER